MSRTVVSFVLGSIFALSQHRGIENVKFSPETLQLDPHHQVAALIVVIQGFQNSNEPKVGSPAGLTCDTYVDSITSESCYKASDEKLPKVTIRLNVQLSTTS
jgi:hypothetical protein